MCRALEAVLVGLLVLLLVSAQARAQATEIDAATAVSDEVRGELLAARERAWRAFFTEEPERLTELLGPELIAIQQHQEGWEWRNELIAMARAIRLDAVRIERLEFPRTEIHLFGDVAILYFTYVFGTAGANWAVTIPAGAPRSSYGGRGVGSMSAGTSIRAPSSAAATAGSGLAARRPEGQGRAIRIEARTVSPRPAPSAF